MDEPIVIKQLSALAQASRLRLFRALVVAGQQGLTPTHLADSLGVASNTLSFHLKELVNSGLISQERQGRNLIYRASFASINGLIQYLTENCCAGQPCDTNQNPSCQ